jgi:DNA adenine methylase
MLEPFLKWPGGKRWLTFKYPALFPSEYNRYLEPFLGGGAVFFFLAPRRSILSDSNQELLNAYKCIRSDVKVIHRRLRNLDKRHCADLYYRIREERPIEPIERATRFLYLNRTCFNGIYRVNLAGHFNVPIGTKTLVEYPLPYLTAVANSLKRAVLRTCDFEKTIEKAGAGDFVFVDPPYTVMHNNNNFVKYNAPLFSWPDQVRLAFAVREADRRGALVMIANADHQGIRDLYAGFGIHHSVSRSSALSADAEYRRKTTELLIINYKAPGTTVTSVRNGRTSLISVGS